MLESPYERRAAHSVSTLWHRDGHARPGTGYAVDTRSVLGVSEVRSPFLVHLLDCGRGQTQTGDRAARITAFPLAAMAPFDLDDDADDDNLDEDDDFDEDDEDSDDEDDDDDADDDVETWQVDFPALNCLD
jgi:hypothetical protein